MQCDLHKLFNWPRAVNHVLAAWMLLALTAMLAASAQLLNDAVMLAALPMGALLCMALLGPDMRPHAASNGGAPAYRAAALLLTALYFVLLSLPNLLSCPLFSEAGLNAVWWRYRFVRLLCLVWNWTGFLAGYALSVYICAAKLLACALRLGADDSLRADPASARKSVLGLAPDVMPLALCCTACVLASAPSLFIGDAPSVWYAVRDGLWDEWHTAGYLLFVKLCSLVWNSQRCVVIVQSAAYVYIHSYAIGLLKEGGCGGRAVRSYVLGCAVCFVPLYFLQALLKDVAFSLALFAFSLGVLRLLRQEGPRARDFIWTGAFGLCTCLFRHAGALPVFCGLVALAIHFLRKNPRALRGCLVTGACVAACNLLLVNVLAYRVMRFTRNPSFVAMSAPMTMIGAVAASGEPIDPEDVAVMERVMPVAKWAACYNQYFADSISRPYGTVGDDVLKVETAHLQFELLRLNARFLVKHTRVYLAAFFDLNSLVWELATPSDGYVRSYLAYPETDVADFVAAQGYAEDGVEPVSKALKQAEDTVTTGFGVFINRYAELLYGMPITRCLFWRGGFALLTLFFSALVLFQKGRVHALVALVPVFALTLGMLFSIPAQEVRYIFPQLCCAGFFGVYAFFAPASAQAGGRLRAADLIKAPR